MSSPHCSFIFICHYTYGGPGWLYHPLLSACLRRQTIGKPEVLTMVKECLIYEKYRHRAGWENAPDQATCRALRVPAGDAQECRSLRPKAWCHIWSQRMTFFRTARGWAAPVGRRWMWGADESAPHMHEGKVIEIRNFLEWGRRTLVWNHQVGVSGFSGCGFDTRGFLDFSVATLRPAVVLGSFFWGLAVFLVAVTLGSRKLPWPAGKGDFI